MALYVKVCHNLYMKLRILLVFTAVAIWAMPTMANRIDGTDGRLTIISSPLVDSISDQPSDSVQLSADGNYAVFSSLATNLRWQPLTKEQLGAGLKPLYDRTGITKIYRVHLWTKEIALISVSDETNSPNEKQAIHPSITADGSQIAFVTDDGKLVDANFSNANVLIRTPHRNQTILASRAPDGSSANRLSWHPTISADGRFTVFESLANNLDPQDMNETWDIYLYDKEQDTVLPISQGNDQSRQADISTDGRWIVYESFATDIVADDTDSEADIYRYDRITGRTQLISTETGGAYAPSISDDGQHIAYLSESGGFGGAVSKAQTVVWNGQTSAVSTSSTATTKPKISGNGSAVYYLTTAGTGIEQLYKTDIATGKTTLQSQFNGVTSTQHINDFDIHPTQIAFSTASRAWLPASFRGEVYLIQKELHKNYLPIIFIGNEKGK